MNNKVHHAFALFFVIFLAVSSFPVLLAILQNTRNNAIRGYDKWLKNRNIEVTQPTKAIKSPYGEELPETPPVVQPQRKGWANSRFTIIRQWKTFKKLMQPERKHVEQWAINTFPFRDEFSTFNMAFKYHLGMRMPIEKEDTILLPNKKMIATYSGLKSSFQEITITKLQDYQTLCDKNGIKFFVVFRPFEMGFHQDYYEPYKGLKINLYQKTANKAAQLEKLGIKTFKLYEAMRSEIPEDQWLNYWYMTDHHWNVDGALVGGKLIADYMNRNCGSAYDLNYFDPETYIRKRWKEVFIGSRGKKLSSSYADGKKDDFDILYPRFDTDFTIEIPKLNFRKQGDFSILLDYSRINYNAYHANPFAAFSYGDKPFIRIVNNKITEGKKIIVIKDSYSIAMIPYLALQTKEIIMLDPRFYPQKKSMETIDKEKPDILFIMHLDAEF